MPDTHAAQRGGGFRVVGSDEERDKRGRQTRGDAKKERISFAGRKRERERGGARWRSVKDVGRFDVRRPSSCALPHRGSENERMAMHPSRPAGVCRSVIHSRHIHTHTHISDTMHVRAIARGSRAEGGIACHGTPGSIVLDCSPRYPSR